MAATRPSALQAALGALGVGSFAAHLWGQLRRFDPGDGPALLRLFRSNRDAGLIVAGALFLAGLA